MILPKIGISRIFFGFHAKIGISAAHGQNIWISLWAPMLKSMAILAGCCCNEFGFFKNSVIGKNIDTVTCTHELRVT